MGNNKPNTGEASATKINELEAQVSQLNSVIDGYKQENSQLKSDLDLASTAKKLVDETLEEVQNLYAQLQSDYSTLQSEKVTLETDVIVLKSEIEKLTSGEKVVKKGNDGIGEVFTYGDKKYKIGVGKTKIPGIGELTALDILANVEAQAYLVSKGSGLIREVTE